MSEARAAIWFWGGLALWGGVLALAGVVSLWWGVAVIVPIAFMAKGMSGGPYGR